MKKKYIAVKEVVAEMLEHDAEFRAEYARLEPYYRFIEAMLKVKKRWNLSQAELAERMNTSQAAVSRLLSGNSFPNWETILKFSAATGTKPEIRFVDI